VTFSWTTACSPKRITFPGADTKNESIGICQPKAVYKSATQYSRAAFVWEEVPQAVMEQLNGRAMNAAEDTKRIAGTSFKV
jgi:hypothetical protein